MKVANKVIVVTGGGNWSAVNTDLTNLYIYSLAINLELPKTLFAGSEGNGEYEMWQSIYPVYLPLILRNN